MKMIYAVAYRFEAGGLEVSRVDAPDAIEAEWALRKWYEADRGVKIADVKARPFDSLLPITVTNEATS